LVYYASFNFFINILKTYSRFQISYFILSLALIIGAIFIGFNIWGSIVVGLVLWMITVMSYTALEFSDAGSQMRHYCGFFGCKVGRWEKLPPITGVTIKSFSEVIHDDSKYNAGIWARLRSATKK